MQPDYLLDKICKTLPETNHYDNLRLDIDASHQRIDNWVSDQPVQRVRKSSAVCNFLKYARDGLAQKLGLAEFLVVNGFRKQWFTGFRKYWYALGGRRITIMDFHALLHDYRKKQQFTEELSWKDAGEHVQNWQDPVHLYATFHYTRKLALNPIVRRWIFKHIPKNGRVLEYGCSLAPYYKGYSRYFSHKNLTWVLADIPNFPFHFTKFTYGRRSDVEQLVTIWPDRFETPLKEVEGRFDAIFLTEVLEHLDHPRAIIEYLTERLDTGGILVFDFMESGGEGLDTPQAAKERRQTLDYIDQHYQILKGRLNKEGTTTLSIARKI